MKKKRDKKKIEDSLVKEPSEVYSGKRIKFFNSMEEENEYTYKMMSQFSPLENLQNVVKLINKMFKEKLLPENISNKRIKFD